MLEIYENPHYKDALKQRLKVLKAERPGLTLKKIASNIGIQYTYLSKSFNQEETHLSEDHLFHLCRLLELDQEELDYILLQRSYEVAGNESRREYLKSKIEEKRVKKQLTAKVQDYRPGQLEKEMDYLFDPQCLLVHVALCIPHYRENPYLLTEKLNITLTRFQEILRILDANDLIDLEEGLNKIEKVRLRKIHFGRNHPLMRIHQNLFKSLINCQLAKTPEEHKVAQLFSFTLDEDGFHEIQEEYQNFIKRVEKIARRSTKQGVYQIAFDLFKWL